MIYPQIYLLHIIPTLLFIDYFYLRVFLIITISQFSLVHGICVPRIIFPRRQPLVFFQLDSHFTFLAQVFFSLGTILFDYVSIPIVFTAPLISVPSANFINSFFLHHVWLINMKIIQLKSIIIQ